MEYFGEYVVVSLGKYFWSSKDKAVVKKGCRISREGTFKHGAVPHHIICKRDSSNTKQEDLDTTTAMGDFTGENFD